jgi:predicted ABC-type transport system involved in lysophospholipase L1 biosynthesis ATPase subunit
VLHLFEELHGAGMTVVLVTHDASVAARAEERIVMRDGRIVERNSTALGVAS